MNEFDKEFLMPIHELVNLFLKNFQRKIKFKVYLLKNY